jgi:pimeloyl-ACP methyl ester carboxylesterase
MSEVRMLTHVHVRLALHQLREGRDGQHPLLVLHGLGERTPEGEPELANGWDGPVFGLDFTGHGRSSRTRSGGFTCEALMADADVALAELGSATVVGRGLGAYVALLIAGARPTAVRGAVLADGPGLAGGGPAPQSPMLLPTPEPVPVHDDGTPVDPGRPDPFALLELARDVRPGDYAATYVRQAVQFSELDTPISVAAVVRPPWLETVVAEPGVAVEPVEAALGRYGALS